MLINSNMRFSLSQYKKRNPIIHTSIISLQPTHILLPCSHPHSATSAATTTTNTVIMGQRAHNRRHSSTKSHTLPSSPTHSSSSSDFEFTISVSPRKSSAALCPADELFYKGQLLPLHLSPRLSLVRTLLLSSASTSSASDTTTTASRDSTASTDSSSSFSAANCDSSRPSSATEDEFRPLNNNNNKKPSKYFSLSKFSSVFRKDKTVVPQPSSGGATVKCVSSSAKEVIRKYFNKVKPLYEKLSQKQQQQQQKVSRPPSSLSRISRSTNTTLCMTKDHKDQDLKQNPRTNMSFSGNLRYPTRGRRSCISSCPSSMGSSPSHGRTGFVSNQMGSTGSGMFSSDTSSMEELQSAIQGAIAHCKNSMLQNNKTMVSNEI